MKKGEKLNLVNAASPRLHHRKYEILVFEVLIPMGSTHGCVGIYIILVCEVHTTRRNLTKKLKFQLVSTIKRLLVLVIMKTHFVG